MRNNTITMWVACAIGLTVYEQAHAAMQSLVVQEDTAGQVAARTADNGEQIAPSQPIRSTPALKWCPLGGESYPHAFRYCPRHGTELRDPNTPSLTP